MTNPLGALVGLAGAGIGLIGQNQQNQFNKGMVGQEEAFQASQTQQQEQYQTQSIANQEAYQTQMSNTAEQRNVADLKAAGINPMLATGQMASTPSGASSSGSAQSGAMATEQTNPAITALQGFSSAVSAQQAIKQLQQTQAQIDNTKADTAEALSRTAANYGASGTTDGGFVGAQKRASETQASLNAQTYNQRLTLFPTTQAQTAADLLLTQAQIPAAQAAANASKTWFGQHIAPFLGSASTTSDIISRAAAGLSKFY